MLKFLSMDDEDKNVDAGAMTIVLQTFMFQWSNKSCQKTSALVGGNHH